MIAVTDAQSSHVIRQVAEEHHDLIKKIVRVDRSPSATMQSDFTVRDPPGKWIEAQPSVIGGIIEAP